MWKENADLASTAAHSNWLVDQIDIRGWAHRFGPEQGENVVKIGWGIYILMLCVPLEDATEQARDNYWDWLQERVLVPLKEESPEMYAQIIEWTRSQIIELADIEPPVETGIDMSNTPDVKVTIAQTVLQFAPPLIQKSILDESKFSQEYGFGSRDGAQFY